MMCSKLLRHETKHGAIYNAIERFFHGLTAGLPPHARLGAAPPHLGRGGRVARGGSERPAVQEPALGTGAHRGSRRHLQLRFRAGGIHGPLHGREPQARRGTLQDDSRDAALQRVGRLSDGGGRHRHPAPEALGGAHAQAAGDRAGAGPEARADPGRARLPHQPAFARPVAAQPAGRVRDHEFRAVRGPRPHGRALHRRGIEEPGAHSTSTPTCASTSPSSR